MTRTSECRSCGAPIIWAHTTSSKMMPVDAEPVANGTLVLTELAGEVLVEYADGGTDGPRHRAHFATCPDSSVWRRRR